MNPEAIYKFHGCPKYIKNSEVFEYEDAVDIDIPEGYVLKIVNNEQHIIDTKYVNSSVSLKMAESYPKTGDISVTNYTSEDLMKQAENTYIIFGFIKHMVKMLKYQYVDDETIKFNCSGEMFNSFCSKLWNSIEPSNSEVIYFKSNVDAGVLYLIKGSFSHYFTDKYKVHFKKGKGPYIKIDNEDLLLASLLASQ